MIEGSVPAAVVSPTEPQPIGGSVAAILPGAVPALSPSRLGWSALRNTAAQLTGRIVVGLARLVAVALIVRFFGKGTFGEYAVLFAILTIAEWLVDFGTTDTFVRDICREPQRAVSLLQIHAAWKMIQVPVAIAFAALVMAVMGLSRTVVEAGLVAAAGLIFYAGVLVYRAVFRATLTMEREMVAEVVSVGTMVGLIPLVARWGGGLTALMGAYLVSRAVFFLLCWVLGRSRYVLTLSGTHWADLKPTFAPSSTIGLNGFIAIAYATIDILLLSRTAGLNDVAYYSGAQRFILPILMMQASIGGTLYSVAASYWPHSRADFERAARHGLNAAVMTGGAAICILGGGADFFMGLLGSELAPGAIALRILAVQTLFAAVPSTLGNLLYVVHGQATVLRFFVVCLIAKIVLLVTITPRFGFVGAAAIALALEIGGAVFGINRLRRITGYRMDWGVPVKVALGSAGAVLVAYALDLEGVLAAVVATTIYLLVLLSTRALNLVQLQALLPRKATS